MKQPKEDSLITRDDCLIPKSRCGGNCGHCHAMDDGAKGPLSGVRMGLSAVVAFLLPLGLAVAGGVIFNQSTDARLLGVLGGLAAGIALAWCINRRIARKASRSDGTSETKDIQSQENL